MGKAAGIRGYTADEVAESRRIELEKDYEKCRNKFDEVKIRTQSVKAAKLELEECKHEHAVPLSE